MSESKYSEEASLGNKLLEYKFLKYATGEDAKKEDAKNEPLREELWKKELRRILRRNIHEEGLGCLVDNTHMSIDAVHLGEFFEAQFLFGNAYWITIFSYALYRKLLEFPENLQKKTLLIGFESYTEPVLSRTKAFIQKQSKENVLDYCIYEKPKYIDGSKRSKSRIRLAQNKHLSEYQRYVILCGISTTLSTFREIATFLQETLNRQERENIHNISGIELYSIIQVLPGENSNYSNIITIDKQHSIVTRRFEDETEINANYFVDIESDWEPAENCKWCYDPVNERPIVSIDETSVIPVQMIGPAWAKKQSYKKGSIVEHKIPKVNFFRMDDYGNYVFSDFLYYNHVIRDGNHYQYYIRTNALLNELLSREDSEQEIEAFCKSVRDTLIRPTENQIHILVAPAHYSNELFSMLINERVFNNTAEVISFDPQKEFRSNFETKYSNYAYVLESSINHAYTGSNRAMEEVQFFFHYVDDQLVTGELYYRTKSFINSLIDRTLSIEENPDDEMNVAQSRRKRMHVFESVIIMLNRNSPSSKRNYVDDDSRYFSMIDLEIPSLRSHGDSCPLCKKCTLAGQIAKQTGTFNMYSYWAEREEYHKLITLEEAREQARRFGLYRDPMECDTLKQRKMRRLYCENELWKALRNEWDPNATYEKIILCMRKTIDQLTIWADKERTRIDQIKTWVNEYEYVISYVKTMSKPLLYHRENVKIAVHSILFSLIRLLGQRPAITVKQMLKFLHEHPYAGSIDGKKKIESAFMGMKASEKRGVFPQNKEVLLRLKSLYVVVLSQLCSIGANHLLEPENIINTIRFLEEISTGCSEGVTTPEIDFIIAGIKRLTNGIAGKYKARKLDNNLEEYFKVNHERTEYRKALERIYLENLEAETSEKIPDIADTTDKTETSKKYAFVLNEVARGNNSIERISLMSLVRKPEQGDQMAHNDWYEYSSTDTVKIGTSRLCEAIKANVEEDFFDSGKYTFIRCYDVLDLQKKDESPKKNQKKLSRLFQTYIAIQWRDENIEREDSLLRLKGVRRVLCYRNLLQNLVQNDVASGAIKEMYEEDRVIDLLSNPKAEYHGQQDSLTNLAALIDDAYNRIRRNRSMQNMDALSCTLRQYSSEDLEEAEKHMMILLEILGDTIVSHIYRRNNYVDRRHDEKPYKYLSFKPLHKVPPRMEDRTMTPDDSEELENPDYDEFQTVDPEIYTEQVRCYFGLVKKHRYKKGDKAIDIQVNQNELENQQINSVQGLRYLSSSWAMLSIVDVLIRNAIKHGGNNGKPITISVKRDKDTSKASIYVWNSVDIKLPKPNADTGITRNALDKFFKGKVVFNDKRPGEFEVVLKDFIELEEA